MKVFMLSPQIEERLRLVTPTLGQLSSEGMSLDALLKLPRVALVGTRKPSPYGKQVTEKLASELARSGIVIISGLAFGVDITAHKAVLSVGGRTIAVLPSGLQPVYPASHARFADDIKKNGALITEYPDGHKPMSHDFLDRNRLIAGLSDLVIVTEAAERSGSLNTASHAKKMNIPVGAVPGPITSAMSSGTNWLLRERAHVITSAQDVLELLRIDTSTSRTIAQGANELENQLLQKLSTSPMDTTQLCTEINEALSVVQTALTMLELNGMIRVDSIGTWHLVT